MYVCMYVCIVWCVTAMLPYKPVVMHNSSDVGKGAGLEVRMCGCGQCHSVHVFASSL